MHTSHVYILLFYSITASYRHSSRVWKLEIQSLLLSLTRSLPTLMLWSLCLTLPYVSLIMLVSALLVGPHDVIKQSISLLNWFMQYTDSTTSYYITLSRNYTPHLSPKVAYNISLLSRQISTLHLLLRSY